MQRLLLRSKEENLPLEMIYLSLRGQITQRRIIVKEIHSNAFQAYCSLRKQTRTFKLEQILSLMPAKNSKRNII